MIDSLIYLKKQIIWYQAGSLFWFQIIQLSPILTTNFKDVFKAFSGNQCCCRTFTFEQHVCGDRGAMDDTPG